MTSVRMLLKSGNARFFRPSPKFARMTMRGTTLERRGVIDGVRRCVTAVDRGWPRCMVPVWTLLKSISAWYHPVPCVRTPSMAFEIRMPPTFDSVRTLLKSNNARFLRPLRGMKLECRRRRSTVCDCHQLWSIDVDRVSLNATEIDQC